jgi:TM2 domain-containing membrane protein YozV/DNA-directed RNA polymerase subunit M/transcription elongation factor TFIIS
MTAIQDCPECGKSLQVPEEDIGQRVACPRCGRQLIARTGNDSPPRQADDNRPRPDDCPEVVAVDENDTPRREPSRSSHKYCSECGARLTRQARYCAECGASRTERDPVRADANNKKTTAGILAILVGSLGVHKFFLGLTTPAVVMLLVTVLTCGIGGIVMHVIGIVEGITYLTRSDEDFYQIYIVQQKEWF